MNRVLLALLLAAAMVAVAQEPKTKPAEPKTAPARTAATSSAIIANKDSKIFHRADCKLASKMKDSNRVSFASAAEAEKAGYKACKVCKP